MELPETFAEAAIAYALAGWCVFPIHGIVDGNCTCGVEGCSDSGKHPVYPGGVKGATKDIEQIAAMWEEYPDANIGVATGQISNITVIDVDIGEGKDGDVTWSDLNREAGDPETLTSLTGGGGMHVIFLYNSALKTGTNVLGSGVDVRNDGGYIVAPPSKHRSGGAYSFVNPGTPLASLPAHLSRPQEKAKKGFAKGLHNRKYRVEEVAKMLTFVSADDRDLWRSVGIILGREYKKSDDAWAVYLEWANTWKGKEGRGHAEIMREAFYTLSAKPGDLSLGTIVKAAIEGGWSPTDGKLDPDKFTYYAAANKYIYMPTNSQWVETAVNNVAGRINDNGRLVPAAEIVRKHRTATSMTNDPDLDIGLIEGIDYIEGSSLRSDGAATYNAYRPPIIVPGDARDAEPFVEHVRRLLSKPGDADQFIAYLAHRVQCPGVKARFALVLAGEQGVGKDTAIALCAPAIGQWNISNIDASALDQNFNEYAASVLVIVNEAANSADLNKWAFNERMKVLIAGLPDFVSINPKYGTKYGVRLHNGTILTTNHLRGGLYIPADDRRYDVIECATREEMGLADDNERAAYFRKLWSWAYEEDGFAAVAAYLRDYDLSSFDPSNGQRKTEAHKAVVRASNTVDDWFMDVIDEMVEKELCLVENGDCVAFRSDAFGEVWKRQNPDEKQASIMRKMGFATERSGYVIYENPNSKRGRWKTREGSDVTIYLSRKIEESRRLGVGNELLKAPKTF